MAQDYLATHKTGVKKLAVFYSFGRQGISFHRGPLEMDRAEVNCAMGKQAGRFVFRIKSRPLGRGDFKDPREPAHDERMAARS